MPEDNAMTPRLLADELASQFAQATELMAGERPSVQAEAIAAPAVGTDLVIWKQEFSLHGLVAYIAAPGAVWTAAGMRVLRASGIEDGDEATAKVTFIEVLKMGFSTLARTLSAHTRKEINATTAHDIPELPPECLWFGYESRFENGETYRFFAGFSAGMANFVADQLAKPAVVKGGTLEPVNRAVPQSIGSSKTLDTLLDVELPVSISFGRAQLPLKDVIKLNTGSIVELNRTVGDPVEIIVNNCVIARGEVVVVEGNFGVKIQEVISKQDRLRTLY